MSDTGPAGWYDFRAEVLPSTLGAPMGVLFELLVCNEGEAPGSVFSFLLDKKQVLALAQRMQAAADKLPDEDDEEE